MKKIKLILAIAIFALVGCSQVDQTDRAVVKVWGEVDGVAGPGLIWYNPISTSLHKMPITNQQAKGHMEASSKDMQKVNTEVLVNFHYVPNKVDSIYSRFGDDFCHGFLDARIIEAIGIVISQYKADTILAMRDRMQHEMKAAIKTKMDSANVPVIIDGFVIANIRFSDEYSRAIEAKQVAEQEAARAEKILDKVEKENEQKVIAARADSTAKVINAIADSIETAIKLKVLKMSNVKEYITLKWIESWDGKLPEVVGNDKMMPIVDLK